MNAQKEKKDQFAHGSLTSRTSVRQTSQGQTKYYEEQAEKQVRDKCQREHKKLRFMTQKRKKMKERMKTHILSRGILRNRYHQMFTLTGSSPARRNKFSKKIKNQEKTEENISRKVNSAKN